MSDKPNEEAEVEVEVEVWELPLEPQIVADARAMAKLLD